MKGLQQTYYTLLINPEKRFAGTETDTLSACSFESEAPRRTSKLRDVEHYVTQKSGTIL